MTLNNDVFFRSHVVELDAKDTPVSGFHESKWPEYALVFDTETTLDPKEQALLFGFYRVCRLQGTSYECVEEGIVHADGLSPKQLNVVKRYVREYRSEVMSDDYDESIHVYSRAEFVERVFFDAVRSKSLIVAFNAPWDISRVSIGYRVSRNRGWTLILSERVSRKTGHVEPNPERPCVRVTSKDAKAAFFSLTKPVRPKEWPSYPVGEKTRLVFRVLDLRTLGWALFNESHSLKSACKALGTKNQKMDHEPTGEITDENLEYARQDVRCTVDVLNSLKQEFGRHPIELYPERAVSPASIGKAYLRAMGIVSPREKFKVPDYFHGIASQAYFGGRAECKIRNAAVPVVLTDFSSQYPTINSLLGNPEILIADRLAFQDDTARIRKFVETITLDKCFNQKTWKKMKFFARIRPDGDVVPVRAEYHDDGVTKNIGVNYLTSSESIWLSGPDIIASKLLTGKTPKIEKAIAIVPHGQQKGLKAINLRGMVEVDPRKHDLFKIMVEQKQVYKESDEALSYFLKICANSTSYGMFYELTPQKRFNPVRVKVFSGEHSHEQSVTTIEKPGEWYFPPIASLITGGSHFLLAMLECCITDRGGHYLFCDTDSMCIVATRTGGWVSCPNEHRIRALSWKDVEAIAARFASLNCYDHDKVPGSILKVEKVNYHKGNRIQLYGYGISAKRYVLYRYDEKDNIVIVDAKAHGLGYLFPPKDADGDDPNDDWIREVWRWLLQAAGVAVPKSTPPWFAIPAMMRITVSTPAILGMLKGFTRPFNFVQVPLISRRVHSDGKGGYIPSLIMPFSKHRELWLGTKAIDTQTGKRYSITLTDPNGRNNNIQVRTYGNIIGAYRDHPEAKFVDIQGSPCDATTTGVLRRSHIIANRHRYVGKETSRRWEQGEDMSMVDFRCAEYSDGKVVADGQIRQRIKEIGIRKIARSAGVNRETVTLIAQNHRVKTATLEKVLRWLKTAE